VHDPNHDSPPAAGILRKDPVIDHLSKKFFSATWPRRLFLSGVGDIFGPGANAGLHVPGFRHHVDEILLVPFEGKSKASPVSRVAPSTVFEVVPFH